MRKHIIEIIENRPFANLSESDLAEIRAHNVDCLDCRQAFEAARVSAMLLKERATETFEPSPFFHTRVLARLREQQTANQSWAWSRMWRAAGALASSMVATVAALAVLTFAMPEAQSTVGPETTFASAYSAEELILDENEPLDAQVSDGHILTTLYVAEEEAVK